MIGSHREKTRFLYSSVRSEFAPLDMLKPLSVTLSSRVRNPDLASSGTLYPRLDRPRPSWSRCDEAGAAQVGAPCYTPPASEA